MVLKFGGTSVSTAPNWHRIAAIARERSQDGTHVLIVHSALSGITDRLERVLDGALQDTHAAVLDDIESVLESNAEEYVGSFVQKGGE